jgi:hypothetical protein
VSAQNEARNAHVGAWKIRGLCSLSVAAWLALSALPAEARWVRISG